MENQSKKASAARIAANERWEAKAYDKVLIRFPKGTKDRIRALCESVNGFTNDSVLQRLEALEQSQGRTTSDLPAE